MKPALLAAFLVTALLLSSCAAADLAKNTGRSAEIVEAPTEETECVTEEEEMSGYDFTEFANVTITGIDVSCLNETELAILYAQARYCQAMTDADIADGRLRYFTIGIADPVIKADGEKGSITYTSVLNANAYGARGTYHMKGTHYYELRDGSWIAVNK
ncbi:MAG: hypothetical protein E7474_04420 [Ruminococcaceae bacterium]|nr:hypothetical protein [Oscillospiraceae bacterium]